MAYITIGVLGDFGFSRGRNGDGETIIHVNVGNLSTGSLLVRPDEAAELIAGLTEQLRQIDFERQIAAAREDL